ncbi:MAG: LrgB family protein, partial [Rikenellaceae bacterium]
RSGVSGSIFGVGFLKLIGVTDRVAIGAALGSASHAVGTARALELGALEGAVGGVAICLMGIFTSLIIGIGSALL